MYAVGYNYGRKNSHATEGHNVMGKVLTEVTEKYRRDQLKPVADTFSELGGILGNADLFRTRQKKSVLVITDSQARHLESVGLGGTVVAVGGAKYCDLLNVMKSGRYHLPDYTMIVLYCGTNCDLSRDYSYKDRDREFDELKKFLKNMLQNQNREIRRSANMIFFASSFNVRNGASLDRKHMDSVKKQLSELGIAYLHGEDYPKVLKETSVKFNRSLFAQDELHLLEKGMHVLWKTGVSAYPKLALLSYKTSAKPKTIHKSEFYPENVRSHVQPKAIQRERSRSPLVDPLARDPIDQRAKDAPGTSSRRYDHESPLRRSLQVGDSVFRSPTAPAMRSVVIRSPLRPKDMSPIRKSSENYARTMPITSPIRVNESPKRKKDTFERPSSNHSRRASSSHRMSRSPRRRRPDDDRDGRNDDSDRQKYRRDDQRDRGNDRSGYYRADKGRDGR